MVNGVTLMSERQSVFNLSVDKLHNNFVGLGGLLVHNLKKGDENGGGGGGGGGGDHGGGGG